MSDYVLVAGAWRGGWIWRRVRNLLAAEGHQVFTPTLSGLAERSHLLSRDIDLDTHVLDVINILHWEGLHDVVLVGHSYGGAVVRHVADKVPDRIRSLVYLDGFVPESGKSVIDYAPDGGKRHRETAASHGDGWKVPPPPASLFGCNAADAEWVDRQSTMHPLSTIVAPARLRGACDDLAKIGYIAATGWKSHLRKFYDLAAERGWWREELPSGHDIMLDMPKELAILLLQRA